jgi:pimeloyl-ACP methyl ester carboxylesterase
MIHALPGMGANVRMYPEPWRALPGFMAHDWPVYKGETTLAAMALRVAGEFPIQDGDTLIGSSLGGMVACEIGKLRKLRQLALIGSTTSPGEINSLLRLLRPLVGVAPVEILKASAATVPSELAQMFHEVDADFIRAMCKAVLDWPGVDPLPCPLIRIHGRHDLVIPAPGWIDLLLDGGHLLAMTHAAE